MGKASGDKHLAVFAFVVYGLIVFPKALGYVNPAPTVLVERPGILEEIGRHINQVGSNLELAIMNLFQPFPLETYIRWHLKRRKNLYKNKEVMKEYTKLTKHFIAVEQMAQAKGIREKIEEIKKESIPFTTRNKPAMKLLEVAQAHYQKFIKLIRRKKKNDE
ncbi:hypothetical protein GOBAR_AA14948 [Gossypium barbadense]|uniref:Uncharacterized protein n=1 Tax=Gossypium barbadense TaxID=3634 RepID=A0A2P5XQS1_GOSBA|nr:hypothetical protein GOBAR_AA14948 [Gossypium barbadense]